MVVESIRTYLAKFLDFIVWSELARLGTARIVKLTIFIPIFGYLIIFNQHIHNKLGWDLNLSGDLFLSPAGRMYALYYAFTFIAVGSILFNLPFGCPSVVARNDDVLTYIERKSEILSNSEFREICRKIRSRRLTYVDNIVAELLNKQYDIRHFDDAKKESIIFNLSIITRDCELYFLTLRRPDATPIRDPSEQNNITSIHQHDVTPNLLKIEYIKLNNSKPILRSIIAILYAIGLVVVTLTSLEVFFKVSITVYESLSLSPDT